MASLSWKHLTIPTSNQSFSFLILCPKTFPFVLLPTPLLKEATSIYHSLLESIIFFLCFELDQEFDLRLLDRCVPNIAFFFIDIEAVSSCLFGFGRAQTFDRVVIGCVVVVVAVAMPSSWKAAVTDRIQSVKGRVSGGGGGGGEDVTSSALGGGRAGWVHRLSAVGVRGSRWAGSNTC